MARRNRNRTQTGNTANEVTIANALADVKYGPEVSAVKDLFTQAKKQYASDIDAAKANAAAVQANIKAQRPGIKTAYKDYSTDLSNVASDVDRNISGVPLSGNVASAIQAGMQRERGTASNRLSDARTAALGELTQRSLEAEAGRQLSQRQARSEYGQTSQTLSSKLQDIMGQRGADVAVSLGDLREKRLARGVQKAGSSGGYGPGKAGLNSYGYTADEWAGLSDKAKADARAGKGGGSKGSGGGGNRATSIQQKDIGNTFKKALQFANDYVAQGASRGRAADDLLRGRAPTKFKDPTTHKDVTTEGIPSFPQFELSLALDMAYGDKGAKGISDANVDRLHRLGYKVTDLPGAYSYRDWVKRNRQPVQRPGTAPSGRTGGQGEQRPT